MNVLVAVPPCDPHTSKVSSPSAVLARGAPPGIPRMRPAPREGNSPTHRPLTQAFGPGSLGR
jgi:hypothetical protein